MKTTLILVLAAVVGHGGLCLGARILAFFPFPSKSHHAVFTPLLRALAARGHHITYFAPHKLQDNPPNIEHILIPDPLSELQGQFDIIEFSSKPGLEQIFMLGYIGIYTQEKLCAMEQFKSFIRSDLKYDLLLTESFFVQESVAALQHKFGAPTVDILPLGGVSYASWFTGAPFNPSYMVDFKTAATDRMNFFQRLMNTANHVVSALMGYYHFLPKSQALVDRCYRYEGSEKRPPLVELLHNKSLVLYNSHFSLNYAYPSSPNAIDISGINIQPSKPLPQDLQKFMDEAKDGVIYFSFGSNIQVSDVSNDKVFHAFVSSFRNVKQKVLWKWENDNFPDKPANVKTSVWFPQQDILAHKNCKLFITHGGYLSISEAVNYGVPLIGVPFFGDQLKNMLHATTHGYGLQLNYDNITESSVSWAIDEILSNPKYSEAARARSEIFQDRPMSALDTAVYWVEYVMRHRGAPQLRPALTDLPWYQYLLLDIAALLIAAVLAVLFLLYRMVMSLYRMIFGPSKRSGRKQKQKKKYE